MSLNSYLCKHFEKDENDNVKLGTILRSETTQFFFIIICSLFALSLFFSIDEIEKLYGIDKNIDIFYVFFILIPTNMIYIVIGIIAGIIVLWILNKFVIIPMFKYILNPLFKIILNICMKIDKFYDKIKYKINNITVAKCKIKENNYVNK